MYHQFNMNRLRQRFWAAEKVFFRLKSHAYCLQCLMLFLFIYLIAAPLFAQPPQSIDTIFSSVTLLSQFLFWGVWYGGCLLSVVLLGRFWCGALCPLGALSEWTSRFGLGKTLPRWMSWDGWLIVMFIVITILGQTMDVRDDPWGMLKLFSYIFILALIIGFIYGRNNGRPWCRYFCPIGKILGVVARISIIDFSSNKGTKPLPVNKNYYVQGRLCPTDYNLPYKVSNNNCIACGRCTFKQNKSGMGVYRRQAGEEVKHIMHCNPSWTEVIFILTSPGLSAGGFLWLILNQYQVVRNAIGAWALNHEWMFMFQPAHWLIASHSWNQQFNILDVTCIVFYMIAYGIVIAALLSLLIYLASLVLNPKSIKQQFLILSYQMIPLSILSIIIGLCGKFFEVMEKEFFMPSIISIGIKLFLFTSSAIWTIMLFHHEIKKHSNSELRRLITWCLLLLAVTLLIALWYPAIFNYKYMSDVEKIRHHLLIY